MKLLSAIGSMFAAKERPKPPAKPVPPAEPLGYPVGIVGESFYQSAIRRCRPGDVVTLLREPTNPHDPQAIVVVSSSGATLGYIPRKSFVKRLVHKERKGCTATILNLNENDGETGNLGVVLDVIIGGVPLGERPHSDR